MLMDGEERAVRKVDAVVAWGWAMPMADGGPRDGELGGIDGSVGAWKGSRRVALERIGFPFEVVQRQSRSTKERSVFGCLNWDRWTERRRL